MSNIHTQHLRCVIEHVLYQNPENGWSVIKGAAKGFDELVTVVGAFAEIPPGTVLSCHGRWKNHPKFGRQFDVEQWEQALPATVYGMEKYLGSGLVKGIGPVYASKIVRHFGEDTLDIIDNDIARLAEVPGIGTKRIERIRESWEKQKDIKEVMVFLQGNGVSAAYAAKIYKQYGKDSITKVKENPYRLAQDIWGIGFLTADKIARNLGYSIQDPRRARAGILHALGCLADEGHCFGSHDQLMEKAMELLGVEQDLILDAMAEMALTEDIVVDGEDYYLPSLYHCEVGVARNLLDIASDNMLLAADPSTMYSTSDIEYDSVQKDAIRTALGSKVMVLTGGPGTGKTTTTKGIIEAYKNLGLTVLLAAPTGRAAKRMSETTGMEAKTIHRLLEYSPMDGFKRDEETPLDGDALIVDECSMLDIVLTHHLLKAVPRHMRLVLVGDIDQLPSVGAGNVLRDIIQSGAVPVVTLTRIFRQALTSRIVTNAHAVNHGLFPDCSNHRDSDFFFLGIGKDDTENIPGVITGLVRDRLPKAYHYTPDQIQVLAPMLKGVVGARNLNISLQTALNPVGPALSRAGTFYRVGDKVMQIKNDYDKGVFNGDIGHIESVDEGERTLVVSFDGIHVCYEASDLDELQLAYACSIHKSQGSEFPVVVVPVTMKHFVMLQRNLIYTAITRAKKLCILVGEKRALSYAVQNQVVTLRNTRLAQRLAPEN